jgi:hypothetical protein
MALVLINLTLWSIREMEIISTSLLLGALLGGHLYVRLVPWPLQLSPFLSPHVATWALVVVLVGAVVDRLWV